MATTRHRQKVRQRKAFAICSICAVSLLLTTLVGCGVLGEKFAVIEWYAPYFEKYFPRWMDDFAKIHAAEHARIAFRAMPSNTTQKVYTMMISHTLSDVTSIDEMTGFLLLGQPVLEPVAASDIDRDDFMPLSLRMACTPDGTLVGYPFGSDIRGFVYYNRDCFKEGHTSEKEVPETFAPYRQWAQKLSKWEVNGQVVYGTPPESDLAKASLLRRPFGIVRGMVGPAMSFMLAYMTPLPDADGTSDESLDDYIGGPPSMRPFRIDNPDFIRGVAEYRDLFLPRATAIADGDTSRMNGFTKGIYAGMEASNWIYGEVVGVDLQVTRFPHAEGRPLKVATGSSGVGVSRESKHKRLAIEWAKYITSTNCQVDGYYGHGYLPCRYSAWNALDADSKKDVELRAKYLGDLTGGHEGYVGLPQIVRRYHDVMDVVLYVPYGSDETITAARPESGAVPPAEEEAPATSEGVPNPAQPKPPVAAEAASKLVERYEPVAKDLQRKIAAETGLTVSVIVRGTPEEMIPSRSYVIPSPIGVYIPLLKNGVWSPYDNRWTRISTEVLTRLLQFCTRDENPMPPEEACKWGQKEAEDILAGRK